MRSYRKRNTQKRVRKQSRKQYGGYQYGGSFELHTAIRQWNMDKFLELIQSGADINEQSYMHDGQTPLILSITYNEPEFFDILLQNGVDVNLPDGPGFPPLYTAVQERNVYMTTALINAGADVNQAETRYAGYTPLIAAINRNLHNFVQVLLENGADVNLADNMGRLPIQLARTQAMRDQLIQAGSIVPQGMQQLVAVQPQPQPQLQGVAYEIHNAFNNIKKTELYAFIETLIPGIDTQVPTGSNDEFVAYLRESMEQFMETLPPTEKAQKHAELEAIFTKIGDVNYTPAYRKILYYSLEFVKQQPVQFQQVYVKTHTEECMTAYSGAGNVSSCSKGMIERFVTAMINASMSFVGTPEYEEHRYDELISYLKPITMRDLVNNYFNECSEGNSVTEASFRACIHEKVQQQLGAEYDEAALNAELDILMPHLGISGGGRRRNKTRKVVRKSKKTLRRKRN